jgi:predicted amidophosphoribosyltransferase
MQKPEDIKEDIDCKEENCSCEENESQDESLRKCRNCYYHVKKGIRRCPYCGILNPTLEQREIWYMMLGVLLVMGIYTYIIR